MLLRGQSSHSLHKQTPDTGGVLHEPDSSSRTFAGTHQCPENPLDPCNLRFSPSLLSSVSVSPLLLLRLLSFSSFRIIIFYFLLPIQLSPCSQPAIFNHHHIPSLASHFLPYKLTNQTKGVKRRTERPSLLILSCLNVISQSSEVPQLFPVGS